MIAAIIVFAAAVYVIGKKDPVPDAGTTPTLPGEHTASSSSARGSSGGVPGSSVTLNRTAVVAFLGDDYTLGTGASGPGKGFTALLADSLAITDKNFGDNGAGYAKTGRDHKSFADQVGAIVAAKPDVIVVSGGRNDVVDDSNTLASAAKDLFSELHTKLPRAILVAVAPFWGDSDHPPAIRAISDSVKSAVESAGGIYLDLPDPLHNHPDFMADASDPNDAGYAAIATALQPELATLLPR